MTEESQVGNCLKLLVHTMCSPRIVCKEATCSLISEWHKNEWTSLRRANNKHQIGQHSSTSTTRPSSSVLLSGCNFDDGCLPVTSLLFYALFC